MLLLPPLLSSWTGHHPAIWIVYMKALVNLEKKFGTAIPDVVSRHKNHVPLFDMSRTLIQDFVISTVDRPLRLKHFNSNSSDVQEKAGTKQQRGSKTSLDHPVFRFCKTEASADIMVPCFHFYVDVSSKGVL